LNKLVSLSTLYPARLPLVHVFGLLFLLLNRPVHNATA
jgi:hypothetical protein